MPERLTKKSELNLYELHAALSRAKQAHTHTRASRQNKKLQLILGYAVRGAWCKEAAGTHKPNHITTCLLNVPCSKFSAQCKNHSAKKCCCPRAVPGRVPAVNLMLLCVFCMHVSADNCNNWRQAKGSRRPLHKALQLTLLQLSRAATAVATIGIGLISMDSMPLSAQPTGSTGRAVYLVR